jgi:hypothetical protein
MWTKEQQKEHRKLWIDALRSGNYKQTSTCLRSKNGREYAYCCLGVACEVYLKSGDAHEYEQWATESTFKFTPDIDSVNSVKGGFLPYTVQEWLGLNSDAGYYAGGALYRDNDANAYTFNDIASVIEAEPKGLINDA